MKTISSIRLCICVRFSDVYTLAITHLSQEGRQTLSCEIEQQKDTIASDDKSIVDRMLRSAKYTYA